MKMYASRRIAAATAAAALLALGAGTRALAQGFGGGTPPAVGTITAVDKTNKTVTLNDNQGNPTTIDIDPNATIVTQATITLGDLKVGDNVRVQGTPTAITATSIVDGNLPRPGGGPGGPGGGPGGPLPGGGPGGPGGPGGGFGRGGGFGGPMVTGTVKTLSPLTIETPTGDTVAVSGASSAKVSKIENITISDLKVGDTIFAAGQTGNDGNLDATFVGENLQFGGGFGGRRGGFGGGFGGGGFGGPPPGGAGG